MLFYILSIKERSYAIPVKLQPVLKNTLLIRDYFSMVMAMFIYFEGGHTLSEILSVFNISEVKQAINAAYGLSSHHESISDQILESPVFIKAFQEALCDTLHFEEALTLKKSVKEQIKEHKITSDLNLSIHVRH